MVRDSGGRAFGAALTEDDELRALMSRVNTAIAAFAPSVGALYLKAGGQRLRQFGSCVFVSMRGQDYILTASHCFAARKQGAIHVGGPTNVVPLQGTFSYTQQKPGRLEPDDIDLAIAPLEPDLKAKLNVGCIAITRGSRHEVPPAPDPFDIEHRYLMIGFPASQHRRALPDRRKVPRNAWAFVTQVKPRSALPKRGYLNPARHLFLEWSYSQIEDETRKPINPPHLPGTSGGAIFSIGRHIESPSHPVRLVGILTDFLQEDRTIVGTRIAALAESLDSSAAWPRCGH